MSRSDTLSRTAKIFLDDGTAGSLEEADEILSRYVLQIDVAPGIERSPTRQVMLLTIMNTASHAVCGVAVNGAVDELDTELARELRGRSPTVHAGVVIDRDAVPNGAVDAHAVTMSLSASRPRMGARLRAGRPGAL